MTTNDALMKKLDTLEKQIQEQNKQLQELLVSLVKKEGWQNIKPTISKIKHIHPEFHLSECLNQPEPCEETKEKLFGKEDGLTKPLVQNMGCTIERRINIYGE